jgi:hypothetical protein
LTPPTPAPTAASTTPTALATWTDPRGLIQLRYPRDWRAGVIGPGSGGTRENNILQLAVPYSSGETPILWLDLHDQQQGTLDDEVQRIRDDWVGKPYKLSEQTIEDLTVGGEAAKAFVFTYTPTFNPMIHNRAKNVVCNHGGREFSFETITDYDNGLVKAAREIEAIIASVRFLP